MSQTLFKGRRVLWMPLSVPWSPPSPTVATCCEAMRGALDFACEQHADPFACADALMVYNEVFDEYGIPVHDGGASYVLIAYCPWCGARLPASQRDRWFDETDGLLGQDQDEAKLPPAFLSGAWRRG